MKIGLKMPFNTVHFPRFYYGRQEALQHRGCTMLYVCQKLASTVQYLDQSFIISYFGSRFTNAYN